MTDTPGTLEERLRKQARRRSSRSNETLEYLAADEIASLRARVEVLKGAATTFLSKLDQCQPHIDNAFLQMSLRCGPYDGPQYGAELAALRQALKDSDNAE